MQGQHFGRVLAHVLPRFGDTGKHDLIQNLAAGVIGDFQRVFDDLHGQAVVFQVHLDGGNALFRAGDLEIHLAMEILHALDVDKGCKAAVIVLNQTAGDAGHRSLNRHAGVHQGQGGAADGTLRSRAVGADHLGDHADGIGELIHIRNYRQKRAFRQSAMTNFAASGRTCGFGFADGITGEIVMVHIAFLGFLPDGVQLLVCGQGIQSDGGKHLGLTPGKEAGTMDPGQDSHFSTQGTNFVLLTAVHPVPLQKPRLDNLLLKFVGNFVQILVHFRVFLQKQLVPLVDQAVPAGFPDVLIIGIHGGFGVLHGGGGYLVKQLLVKIGMGVIELRLADFSHHLVNQGDLLLIFLMGHLNRLEHGIVIHLIASGLDHDDLFAGRNHGHIQIRDLPFLAVGIEDQFPVHKTHLQRAHGTSPGDIGNGQRRGSPDQSGDFGRAVVVHAHDGSHNGNVVAEIVREQGPDGAVNDTAGQDALFAGAPFTTVEAAGDTSHGIELFLKVHAEGEEIDSVSGPGGGGSADQNAGIAVAHHHGGVGQFRQLAGLQRQGAASQLHLILMIPWELSLGYDC